MKTAFKKYSLTAAVTLLVLLSPTEQAWSQAQVTITGPKSGFPVAIPQMCDSGGATEASRKIPATIMRNLQIAGLFQLLNPSSYVETPGKCTTPESLAYSDWSVIGAQGLVKGDIKVTGAGVVEARLYLFDVAQQRAVVGKQYQAEARDVTKIAHKFSNEIMRYFTGEPGVFGTRLAYISKVGRFKELFVMDLDGSNNKQLTSDRGLVLSPSWSPSTDRVVYTSYRTRQPELYTITPDGASWRQLTKTEGLELGAEYSPDGNSIAASASREGVTNLVLYDLRGTLLRQLTQGGAIDVSPTWSPDGARVAFCSNRAGGPQIYVMSAGGGPAQRISFTQSNYCTSPSWSPKGDKVAFVCLQGGTNQIFVAAPDGSQNAQLTYAGGNEDPSFSPDGRYLAFSSTIKGPRSIFVASLLNTGNPVQITTTKSEDSQPAWSSLVE